MIKLTKNQRVPASCAEFFLKKNNKRTEVCHIIKVFMHVPALKATKMMLELRLNYREKQFLLKVVNFMVLDSNLEIVMTLALEYDIEFIRSAVREYMEMRLEEQLNSRNGGAINHMTTLLG